MPAQVDIAIVGGGPAGLSLAAACARRGLSVAVVDPDPAAPWPHTYGVWADEVDSIGLAEAVAARWEETEIHLGARGSAALGRGYALLDNERARASLVSEIAGRGGSVRAGRARAIHHGDRGAVIEVDDGEIVGRVAVDASGTGAFTRRRGPPPRHWQVAVGVRVRGDHPYAGGAMRLMDFDPEGLARPEDPPTFLYAMPLADGVFVEETSLVAAPGMSVDALRARLERRLRRDGVGGERVGAEEIVRIPMDVALPALDQPTLAFGAAAGLIHPATGYQVGRAFRAAPQVAEALAHGLRAGEPAAAVRGAWEALWPASAEQAHALYTFGARFLASLDTADTLRFFEAFFSLPRASWVAYLAGDLPPGELARIMLAVFGAVGGGLRLRMMRLGADPHTLALLRPFTPFSRSLR